MKAVLITPRGEKQEAIPKDGVAFTVRELQDLIQGFVEIVDIDDELIMVYDVEGAEKGKIYNETATRILYRAYQEDHKNDTDEEREQAEPFRFVSGYALVCGNQMVRN